MDFSDRKGHAHSTEPSEVVGLSKQFKITEWNSKGFEEILCSSGASNVCEQQARAIQARANSNLNGDSMGFGVGGKIVEAYKSNRWMYFVYTTDRESMIAEQYDQALTKAVN